MDFGSYRLTLWKYKDLLVFQPQILRVGPHLNFHSPHETFLGLGSFHFVLQLAYHLLRHNREFPYSQYAAVDRANHMLPEEYFVGQEAPYLLTNALSLLLAQYRAALLASVLQL